MSKTLAQIIATYEARRAAETVVLTPQGAATVAALRLRRQLVTLQPNERGPIVAHAVADLEVTR